MKDQELRDFFHSYRPELSDEEEFMARLNERMDSLHRSPQLGRRWGRLLWAAGIAAAIVVALLVIKPTENNDTREATSYSANQDYQAMLSMTSTSFPTYEETVAEIEQSGEQLQLAIAEMKK